MALVVLLVLVGGPLVLAAVAVAIAGLPRRRVGTGAGWARVRATWVAAAVVGGLVAWQLVGSLRLGRGAVLVPGVLGFFVVAGVALGETVVRPRRPAGPRTASLAPRRVVDHLPPRPLLVSVAGVTVLHLATLVLTTATATADDLGRAGRQVAARCGDLASAAGPYPGRFYSGPLALVLLAAGLATAAALVAVVRRPRGFAADEAGEDALRRRSSTRVLAASGAAVAASQAGTAFFAGTALLRLTCDRPWMAPVGVALLVSVLASLGLLGWFLGRVVDPGVPAAATRQPVAPR